MKFRTDIFKDYHKFGWYVFACLFSLAMIIPLFLYPGNAVHMAIGVLLSICAGLLIVFKPFSLKVSAIILAVYVLLVPAALFDRMELPIHDMTNMMPLAKLVTVGIFFALYSVFYVIFQHASLSFAVGNSILLLVTIIEFYVEKFRGTVIGPNDLLAAKTAMMVMGNYDYSPSHELIYSIVLFLFFIVLACKINVSAKEIKKTFPNYPTIPVHIVSSVAVLAFAVSACLILFKTDFLNSHGINMDKELKDSVNVYVGSILYPICAKQTDYLMLAGETFAEAAAMVAEEKSAEPGPAAVMHPEITPTVILIMNESFSDLRVLGDFETTKPVMPYWDSLLEKEGVVSGNLYVPVLGGLTVNSEFEALTGNSLFFMPEGTIPYYTMLNKKMDSLASEFKNEGYYALAVHPNVEHAYDRDNAYEQLQFDDFCDIYDFDVPYEYVNEENGDTIFITDNCNYDELISLYEKRDKETPLFIFNVTIQNHGGYWGNYVKLDVSGIGGEDLVEGEYYKAANQYLTLINDSDVALQKLIEYFENVEEPVVICMFGDHQPILDDEFYPRIFRDRELSEVEQMRLKYISKYMIWANYDAGLEDMGDFSANYLGAVLLKELGFPLSEFRQYQLNLMEKLPILSLHEATDSEGNHLTNVEVNALDEISYYKIHEYRQMYGGN